MEFTDWMIWKLVVIGVVAFCYSFWKAWSGD